jgi:hypothetical protein
MYTKEGQKGPKRAKKGQKEPKRVKIKADAIGRVKQQKRNKRAQITTINFLSLSLTMQGYLQGGSGLQNLLNPTY